MYKRIALLGTILLLNSGIVRQPAIAQFLPRLPDFDSNSLEKEGRDLLGESLQLAQLGMHNLLDGSGVEHISQVQNFC